MHNDIIAVFLNDDKEFVSLALAKRVYIYKKINTVWTATQEHHVDFDAAADISSLRREVRALADRLGDCRIAAGMQMTGIIYRELDHSGFSIFEIAALSPDVLDGILQDMRESDRPEEGPEEITQPMETAAPGVYTFDLIQFQNKFPEKSSKQALKNFLEHTPFYELKLTCSHIPPWLEKDYQIETTTTADGRLSTTVKNKQCGSEII